MISHIKLRIAELLKKNTSHPFFSISLTMIDDDVKIVTTIVVTKDTYDDGY
jgi:hypothetical protein